jgi:hypothetical protein
MTLGEKAGCLGCLAAVVVPIALVIVAICLHSDGIALIPTRLTDEELCFARGERLVGHVGDELQCEHVDHANPEFDYHYLCRLDIEQSNASDSHVFGGYR